MYVFPATAVAGSWSDGVVMVPHHRLPMMMTSSSCSSSSFSLYPRHQFISRSGGLHLYGVMSRCYSPHLSLSGLSNHSLKNNNIKIMNRHIIYSSSTYSSSSARDDDDYDEYDQVLEEHDVVTFLDPPKELIPFDPSSYNPFAYLWKKIEDVPEERRHRLLHLLQSRLITRAWGIAGTKYDDPKLTNKTASALLSDGDSRSSSFLEFWNCRTSGGPMPLSWINSFKKAIFRSKDGRTCGRLSAGSFVGRLAYSSAPLYFTVSEVKEVMSTEHPCDFAYHFGDGLSGIHDYPSGFPKPAKHPWPFNDQVVIYVRRLGPGVLVGQAWQEGEDLEKLPQKLCGEILMVKDYYATSVDKQ